MEVVLYSLVQIITDSCVATFVNILEESASRVLPNLSACDPGSVPFHIDVGQRLDQLIFMIMSILHISL